MRGRDDGFTLLEMIVVLAIMGLLIGVVVMHGPVHSQALQTRAAAGALAQALRQARATAMAQSRDVSVVIDPATHSFAADGGPVLHVAPSMQLAVLPPALRARGNARMIRFSPDGSATGGEVLLGSAGRRVEIDVQWLTGQVQVTNAP